MGPSPPVRHDQIDAAQRVIEGRRQLGPIVADHGLEQHVDAGVVQRVGDDQRIRIDAAGREELAPDGEDRGRAGRLRVLTRTLPGRAHQGAQREVRINARHRVVQHDAGSAVQMLEAACRVRLQRRRGCGTERSRRRAPAIVTSSSASVTSMPITSSMTTGPGSLPSSRSTASAAQIPTTRIDGDGDELEAGVIAARIRQVDDEAGGRAGRAWRKWKEADIPRRGEEHREATHARSVSGTARTLPGPHDARPAIRSCSARPSALRKTGRKPGPAVSSDSTQPPRAEQRSGEIDTLIVVVHDADAGRPSCRSSGRRRQ